jgi:transmembrane sensor
MKPRFDAPSGSPVRPGSAAGELAWAASAAAADEVVVRMAVLRRQRRRRQLAAGAGFVGLLALAFAFYRPAPPTTAPSASAPIASRSVEVTGPRELRLPDGSRVVLDGNAQISVAMSDGLRRVTLSLGEAHFDVAKDPARPFIVAAGGVEVRAVGTSFAVRHDAATVDVLVTEGKVAVSHATAAPAFAAAGSRVLVSLASGPAAAPLVAQPVSKSEQGERLAWRLPQLRFSATPLSEAVGVFNRHASDSGLARLALDPALAHLQVSGTLRADDLDSLLVLLRNDFGLIAESQSDGTFRLRRP